MSRWPTEIRPSTNAAAAAPSLCIGWDSSHLAWRLSGESRHQLDALHGLRHWQPALPERLREVHVIASHRVAVHWTQQPFEGLRSMDELHRAAAARCALLFGGVAGDWWLAADWQASRPFVCAALPRARLLELQQALGPRAPRLHWHSAAMLQCQSPPSPPEGWVAARSVRRLLLWHQREGRADALLSWPIAHDAPAEHALALAQEGQRRLREAQRPGDDALHWLQGPAPQAGLEEAESALQAGRWIR